MGGQYVESHSDLLQNLRGLLRGVLRGHTEVEDPCGNHRLDDPHGEPISLCPAESMSRSSQASLDVRLFLRGSTAASNLERRSGKLTFVRPTTN